MKLLCSTLVSVLCLALVPTSGQARTSVRYALIIGNNHGRASRGLALADLTMAEAEAARFKKKLISLGDFDKSGQRVILLLGASREEIIKAAIKLARRHREDREQMGDVPTLFVFYFSGHGLEQELLTAGDPLKGADLAFIFKQMSATFTVGIFDACFSGSLDLDTLRLKGLRTTPGFNAFEELPREVLNSKGTMWFVSSLPDQVSYEDNRLGGVFSHYFMEGMEKARSDRIGVTLEEIWEYASSRTQRYTTRNGHPQTPQKLVRNLTSSGPLYLSFPHPRDAMLAIGPQVSGRFLLWYESGQLTEMISKKTGKTLFVPMYPGQVILEKIDQQNRERMRVYLASGSTIWVRANKTWKKVESLGFQEILTAKGSSSTDLCLTQKVPKWSGLVGLEYQMMFGSEFSAVTMHNPALTLSLESGLFHLHLSGSYGHSTGNYDAWGYCLDRFEARLASGLGLNLLDARLIFAIEGSIFSQDIRYDNGSHRPRGGFGLGGSVNLAYPIRLAWLSLYLVARLGLDGLRAEPVAPIDAPRQWSLVPRLSLGLSVGVF